MKHSLLTLLVLALNLSYAQKMEAPQDAPQPKGQISAPPAQDNQLKTVPFWTEDFGGGFPSTWSVIDSSGICPWTYSLDGSWGYFNGNNGTSGTNPIASTTALNGFLICDPDSANNAVYGQPSGSNYQYLSSYFATDAINCSGRSSVILTFEQFFRYNNGVSMNVQVSNNGTVWETFNVSGGQGNNLASPNAQLITLNISNIAANQSTVYLRFGWSARVYYWMIDDISLREAEPNDVMIGDNWWGGGQYQYQYSKIPMSQISPISFYSEISNNTGGPLSNVFSVATVLNGASLVFQGTSSTATLAAVELDTFVVTTNWTPAAIGTYDLLFNCDLNGATDGDLTNNDGADSVTITSSVYGLDNLYSGAQSTGGISNFSGNTGLEFRIGNIYEIVNDGAIECVEAGISDIAQNDGKSVYAEVHIWDSINNVWELRGLSDVIDLVTADLGQIINMPLFTAAPVYAGEEALVVVGHYGGATNGSDDVRFMYGQSVQEGMVYGFDAGGTAYYLSNPRAIVVRANFDCGLSVAENDFNTLEVFPNPAQTELSIRFEGNGDEMTWSLIDAQGKIVRSANESTVIGANEIKVNTANLNGGVYSLKLHGVNGDVTERVVIF